MRKDLFLLAACYFCGVTVFFANTTIINIIAKKIINEGNLAPNYATFPFGFLAVFTASVLGPAGIAMNRYGHKKVFMFTALLGLVGSLVCISGLYTQATTALCLFTFGVTLQGCAYGVVNYYRHIAVLMGGTDDAIKSWCVAVVISSGALAGVAGPGIPTACRYAFPDHAYLSVYITLVFFYACHVFLLFLIQFAKTLDHSKAAALLIKPSPLRKVISRPKYIHVCLSGTVSNGFMMMIMGMSPVLLVDQVSLVYLALIVQLHAVSMFVPSFFTSKLIGKFGALPIICTGYFIGAVGAGLYLIDDGYIWDIYAARTVSLIFIGIGWNFTFVSSTTLLAGCYNQNEKLKAQSFNDTCLFGLGGILSILCGTIIRNIGLYWLIVISLIIYLCLAVFNLVYIWMQNHRRRKIFIVPSIVVNKITVKQFDYEQDLPCSYKF